MSSPSCPSAQPSMTTTGCNLLLFRIVCVCVCVQSVVKQGVCLHAVKSFLVIVASHCVCCKARCMPACC